MAIQINVTVAGQTAPITAYPYSALPKKGHAQVVGKLNGQPYTFILTKGQGRGTVVKYCAYFVLDGRIYYFYTGPNYLQSGAVIQVVDQAKPAPPAPAPVAPPAPAKPAAKKAPAKTSRKAKVTA